MARGVSCPLTWPRVTCFSPGLPGVEGSASKSHSWMGVSLRAVSQAPSHTGCTCTQPGTQRRHSGRTARGPGPEEGRTPREGGSTEPQGLAVAVAGREHHAGAPLSPGRQLRAMSSRQQVWHTAITMAVLPPGRSSPTATVHRSPGTASGPRSPGSASGPRSPGTTSGPRSPGSASGPRSPGSASGPRSPSTPGSEKVASPLECSICFSGYDNIFKTPKELSCTHVFCLECLARLAAAQPTGRPGCEAVPCPFCRQPTPVPAAGAPALRTSRQLQARMPAHLRREEAVWLEGTKLCCRPSPPAPGGATPGFVCVDVGLSKPAEAAPPTPAAGPAPRRGRLARCWARCRDWRRMALVCTLLLVLFCVVLWPVECALKTGSLRCLPRPPSHTATATVPYVATFSLGPLADN